MSGRKYSLSAVWTSCAFNASRDALAALLASSAAQAVKNTVKIVANPVKISIALDMYRQPKNLSLCLYDGISLFGNHVLTYITLNSYLMLGIGDFDSCVSKTTE